MSITWRKHTKKHYPQQKVGEQNINGEENQKKQQRNERGVLEIDVNI